MRVILLSFLMGISIIVLAQPSSNMDLLSDFDPTGLDFNDVWGYVDADGKEYAITGSRTTIYFVDVTDCSNPVLVYSHVPGGSVTWRDFKTFGPYVYAVCDSCNEGLNVYQFTGDPNNPVQHVLNDDSEFSDTHNIFIDEENARLYAIGNNESSEGDPIIFDISGALNSTPDPNPVVLASLSLSDGYIHDLYVKDNIGYASHGYTGLTVYDFTDPTNPISLGNVDTGGYNHSAWTDANEDYVYYAEELPAGRPLGVIDLANIGDPINDIEIVNNNIYDPLESGNLRPHNPYVLNNFMYVSYYHDGVKVYDISDRENPEIWGYYDIYPQNNGNGYSGFAGTWGIYPFLPSGCILASDDVNGLNMLQMQWGKGDICTPHIEDSESYIYSGSGFFDNYFYSASNNLISTAIIPYRVEVEYNAEFSICLEPGFEVNAGAVFTADIKECTPSIDPNGTP